MSVEEQVLPATKTCSHCHLLKPSHDFRPSKRTKDGLLSWCISCNRAYQRERHQTNPDRRRAQGLEERYKITIDDYDRMLAAQKGVCAICNKPNAQIDNRTGKNRRLHVDHDHETGEVRGLLCGLCNVALGLIEMDPERLLGLIKYLEDL